MTTRTRRALITGITGQDGSYLAELLLTRGYEVIGVVRRSSTLNFERIGHIQDRLTLVPGDLLDQSSLTAVVAEHRPDEVYNLAAQSFVMTSFCQPVLTSGPRPTDARLTMILVHGRGASAEDILALAREFQLRDVAYVAPQAAGHTWYPYSFLAPIAQNEPGITSAFGVLSRLVESLRTDGVEAARIGFLGFSQGGCLGLEY